MSIGPRAATVATLLSLATPIAAQTPAGLTLRAAVAEALEHCPDLRGETDAVRLADIRRQSARADFATRVVPTMALTSDPLTGDLRSAGVTVSKRLATGAQIFANVSAIQYGGSAATLHDTAYMVGVSQPLLSGFSRTATAGVATASHAVTSAERGLAAARAALVVRVAAEYFALVKNERVLESQEQALNRAASFKAAAEARTSVGLATELDLLRARSLESQMTSGVMAARGALADARDRLVRTLGRPAADGLDLAAGAAERELTDAARAGVTLDDALHLALASRLEIREARDRAIDANRAVDVARLALRPPIALDVIYTHRAMAAAGMGAFSPAPGGWRVGLSATYGADRATAAAQAETAMVAAATAERESADMRSRIETEVRQAYRVWQTAEAMMPIRRDAADIAERELAVAELRFERGLASSLDVSSAHGQLLEAKNAITAAACDRVVAAFSLQLAIGALDAERWRR